MKRLMVLATTGIVAACGGSSPTEPTNPLGVPGTTYQLTSYDGGGLPALYSTSLGLCGGRVISASLTALPSSRAMFRVVIDTPCSAGNPIRTQDLEGAVGSSSAGVLLNFGPPDVTVAYADTIQLNGATATMRHRAGLSTVLEAHTYVFTRQ